MDSACKMNFGIQFYHPWWIGICIQGSFHIHIISYNIRCRIILFIFCRNKKSNNLLRIFKPFIVIQIHEPFSTCFFQAGIASGSKIITPDKINYFICILFCQCTLLSITSCIYQYDFCRKCIFKIEKWVQTFLHLIPSWNQHRNW